MLNLCSRFSILQSPSSETVPIVPVTSQGRLPWASPESRAKCAINVLRVESVTEKSSTEELRDPQSGIGRYT